MTKYDFFSINIMEIINIKRKKTKIKTENKSCFVISCRLDGESTFFFNGSAHTIKRGDILYIPYGACYEQACEAEEIVAFHVNIYGNPSNEIFITTPENPDEVCQLFRHASIMWKEKIPNHYFVCMSDLYKILAMSNIAVASDDSPYYGIIAPSIQYLHAHLYDASLSLETVCNQSYISQTSFIKHFRQHFKCSPIKYVNQARIQKAKMLLDSHLYTREEIAHLCGYDNVKHFYVVFKQVTGMTTGQYINRQQKVFGHSLSDKKNTKVIHEIQS